MSEQTVQNLITRVARLPGPGPLAADVFRYEFEPVPSVGDGQILIEVLCQTIDAGSRAMLEASTDYVVKLKAGSRVACSATLGIVRQSAHPAHPVGQLVRAMGINRQQYHVLTPEETLGFAVVPPGADPLAYLGILGLTGFTSWLGIMDICRIVPGETLVVSAAAGAVGSVAGQFGRKLGARVVGIAGGPEKCARVRETFGFDACVDYRSPGFAADLAAACPGGIDAYFENVGGDVQKAVFPLMNDFGRIAMCGQVAQYSGAGEMAGPNLIPVVLRRLELKGFLASDHFHRIGDFTRQVEGWMREGDVVQAVTISPGAQALHEAINMLAEGRNFGQQIHQLCSDEVLAEAIGPRP